MKTAMLNNQVVVLDKVSNKSQNLCSVANQIRHITKCDTKTAYAKAKEMLAAAEAKTSKKVHSRGKYVRDEAWKAQHAAKMREYWETRHKEAGVTKTEKVSKVHNRGKYVRDEAWKAKKAEQMKTYWAGRR